MGRVYRARHLDLDADVALKALHRGDDARLLRGFRDEIEATARLDHPHVARVLAHGVSGAGEALVAGTPWFAMELLRGELRQEVRGIRSWNQVVPALHHLMDALAHAHARGVVHRDLKPSNILFGRPDDLRPGLKLVDFGIAALHADSVRGMGTPSYMAPEQWDHDLAAVGPWSDVYALGVLIWRLVTGGRPVFAKGAHAIRAAQAREDFVPYRPMLAVPDGLEAWLRVCMAAAPGQRFLSVADARWALDRLTDTPLDDPTALEDEETTAPLDDLVTLSLAELERAPAVSVERGPTVAPVPEAWSDPLPQPAPMHLAGAGRSLLPWREPALIGREDARAELWGELLEAVRSGTPRQVHLSGAPGAGVSALGNWLVTRVRARSGALAASVRGQAGGREGAGPRRLVDALLQPLGAVGDPTGRRPGLTRIGATHRSTMLALERLEGGEDEAALATVELLSGLARCRPVVVFLDDVDADPSLAALVDHVDQLRGAILVVWRGGVGGGGGRSLELRPLDATESGQLVSRLLPLVPSLEHRLAERAAGRPGVLRRLLMQIDPELRWAGEGFTLDGELPGPDADLLDVLDGLGDQALEQLELAALLGGDVPRALWVRAAGISPAHADALTHDVVSRGVARDRAGLSLDPEVAEALRRRARAAGRAVRHHAAAAMALDALGGDPLRRGRAWIAAGQAARGVSVWLDGWDHIIRTLGPRALSGALREAREVLTHLPEQAVLHGRAWLLQLYLAHEFREPDAAARAAALADEAEARGWPDVGLDAMRLAGLTLVGPAKDELYGRALARFADASAASASRVWFTRYVLRERFAHPARDATHARATTLLRQARQEPIPPTVLMEHARFDRMLHVADAVRLEREGQHERALAAQQAAVAISRRHGALSLCTDLTQLGLLLAAMGQPERADAVFVEAGQWAGWLGLTVDQALATTQRAGLAITQGAFQRGADLALRALPGTENDYLEAALQLFVWTARVRTGVWDAGALERIGRRLAPVQPPDHEIVAAIEELERQAMAEGRVLPRALRVLARS